MIRLFCEGCFSRFILFTMACSVGCFVSQRNRIKWKKVHKQENTTISGCQRPPLRSQTFLFAFFFWIFQAKDFFRLHNGWKTIENQFVAMAEEDWTGVLGRLPLRVLMFIQETFPSFSSLWHFRRPCEKSFSLKQEIMRFFRTLRVSSHPTSSFCSQGRCNRE